MKYGMWVLVAARTPPIQNCLGWWPVTGTATGIVDDGNGAMQPFAGHLRMVASISFCEYASHLSASKCRLNVSCSLPNVPSLRNRVPLTMKVAPLSLA